MESRRKKLAEAALLLCHRGHRLGHVAWVQPPIDAPVFTGWEAPSPTQDIGADALGFERGSMSPGSARFVCRCGADYRIAIGDLRRALATGPARVTVTATSQLVA